MLAMVLGPANKRRSKTRRISFTWRTRQGSRTIRSRCRLRSTSTRRDSRPSTLKSGASSKPSATSSGSATRRTPASMLSKLRWPSPGPHRQRVRSLASRTGSRPSVSSTTRSPQPITHSSTSTTAPSPAETASRASTIGSSQSPTVSSRPSIGRDEVEAGTRETFLWPSGLVPD